MTVERAVLRNKLNSELRSVTVETPLTDLLGGDLDEPLTVFAGGDEVVREGLGSAATAETRPSRRGTRILFLLIER